MNYFQAIEKTSFWPGSFDFHWLLNEKFLLFIFLCVNLCKLCSMWFKKNLQYLWTWYYHQVKRNLFAAKAAVRIIQVRAPGKCLRQDCKIWAYYLPGLQPLNIGDVIHHRASFHSALCFYLFGASPLTTQPNRYFEGPSTSFRYRETFRRPSGAGQVPRQREPEASQNSGGIIFLPREDFVKTHFFSYSHLPARPNANQE